MRVRPAVLLAVVLVAAAVNASAQPLAGWTGSIRCDIQAQAAGYSHQETQTWTLTGAAPTVQGSVTVYPATWTVTAQGSHDRTRNASRRVATWTAGGPPVNAPIGFTMHALGRDFDVAKWHAQLTIGSGYTGTDQFINGGVPQTPTPLATTIYEWQFAKIEAPTTETQLTGTSTSKPRVFVGPMQPEDAQVTVTCVWSLARGSAPPPLPPSTMPPPVSTSPSTTSSNTPSNPPSTAPAPVAATPPSTTTPVAPAPAQPQTAIAGAPPAGVTLKPGAITPVPASGGSPPAAPRDPANFTAKQTADGTVVLTWAPVTGAGSYLVGGPGLNVGVTVTGTSHTVTGLSQGQHTWTVASIYAPGGVLTTASNWSKATATVANKSGRYRVVVNGFRVNRPTFDDRAFGDGDEVYASAAVSVFDRRTDAVISPRTIITTDIYGDVSRTSSRVQAGSFSPTGGLWNGDAVPAGADPRSAMGAPSARRFPWVVWEGTLQDGVEAVVVTPVLWEADGQSKFFTEWSDPNNYYRQQPARASAQAAAVKSRATDGDTMPFLGLVIISCASNTYVLPDCDPGNDRPIGINHTACAGDGFAADSFRHWCELTMVVTREGIEKALASTSQIGGTAAGVITIPLVDTPGVDSVKGGLDGNYDLFIRLERVP